MNDDEAINVNRTTASLVALLERLPVQPAPIAELTRRGYAARRRRRRYAAAGTAAAAALVVATVASLTTPWSQDATSPATSTPPAAKTQHKEPADYIIGDIVPEAKRGTPMNTLGPNNDGDTLDLHSLRGHVVFIVTFGAWCRACVDQLPALAALRSQTNETDLAYLGIDARDTNSEPGADFLARAGLDFPVINDPGGTVLRSLPTHVRGLPSITMLDRSGRFAAEIEGLTSLQDLEGYATTLTAEPPA